MHFKGPLDARQAGIETVFQNLALADDLDVPSNLFLGREKIWLNLGPFSILDFKGMRAATEKALLRTAVKIPNLQQLNPQNVGRPEAMRGDCPHRNLCFETHHHG